MTDRFSDTKKNHFSDTKKKWGNLRFTMSRMDEDDWIAAGFTLIGGLMILCSSFLIFGWPSLLFWIGVFFWNFKEVS